MGTCGHAVRTSRKNRGPRPNRRAGRSSQISVGAAGKYLALPNRLSAIAQLPALARGKQTPPRARTPSSALARSAARAPRRAHPPLAANICRRPINTRRPDAPPVAILSHRYLHISPPPPPLHSLYCTLTSSPRPAQFLPGPVYLAPPSPDPHPNCYPPPPSLVPRPSSSSPPPDARRHHPPRRPHPATHPALRPPDFSAPSPPPPRPLHRHLLHHHVQALSLSVAQSPPPTITALAQTPSRLRPGPTPPVPPVPAVSAVSAIAHPAFRLLQQHFVLLLACLRRLRPAQAFQTSPRASRRSPRLDLPFRRLRLKPRWSASSLQSVVSRHRRHPVRLAFGLVQECFIRPDRHLHPARSLAGSAPGRGRRVAGRPLRQ